MVQGEKALIFTKSKSRPQGGPFVYMSDFFDGVKVKFFRFISKQIPYMFSLNTLVFESIKISWELIVYFSMEIKNPDLRGDVYLDYFFDKTLRFLDIHNFP